MWATLPGQQGARRQLSRSPGLGGAAESPMVRAPGRRPSPARHGGRGRRGVWLQGLGKPSCRQDPGCPQPSPVLSLEQGTPHCVPLHSRVGRALREHTCPSILHPVHGCFRPVRQSQAQRASHLPSDPLHGESAAPAQRYAPPQGTSRPLRTPCTDAAFQALWLAWPAGDPSAPTAPPRPGPPWTPGGPAALPECSTETELGDLSTPPRAAPRLAETIQTHQGSAYAWAPCPSSGLTPSGLPRAPAHRERAGGTEPRPGCHLPAVWLQGVVSVL